MSAQAQTVHTEPNPAKVALDNDQFRKFACLGETPPYRIPGKLVWTSNLGSVGDDFVGNAIKAVGEHTTFDEDNDPEGYHDFGAIDVEETKIFFKIDLYELGSDFRYGSEFPDDPRKTDRVLTIMLASDW